MAEDLSKGEDSQRSGSEKKATGTDNKKSADDAAASSKAPSRVHIFKDKPAPGASSKPGGDKLQRSSFSANRAIHSAQGTAQAVSFVRIQLSIVSFKDDLMRLKQGIEKGTMAIHAAAMKAEDLGGFLQTLRRTRYSISKRPK